MSLMLKISLQPSRFLLLGGDSSVFQLHTSRAVKFLCFNEEVIFVHYDIVGITIAKYT